MKWEDLVRLVEQVFDDIVREEGETFIICSECGELSMKLIMEIMACVPVVSLTSRMCKNIREKKKK